MRGLPNFLNFPKLDPANDEAVSAAGAGQAGGQSSLAIVSAATINATVVKASAGRLYGYVAINFDGSALCFVKFYDKATAPDPSADQALLKWQAFVHAGGGTVAPVSFVFPHGLAFADGIGLVITTDADTGETAVGASDVFLQVTYK